MGDLLIRNVDEHVVERLKAKAEINGTSLQVEAKKALTHGAQPSPEERRAIFERLDRLWGDRPPLTVSGAEIVRGVRDENGW